MSARKADAESGGGSIIRRWIGWLGSDSGAAGLIVLLLVLWPAMWYLVWRGVGNWRGVGEEVLSSAPYWLTVEQVAVTPAPAWIHCDVRADVFRDASLDGPLSILEPDLVERLADAFSLHPWVKKVVRIRKYHPAAVTVEVVYRRPACMVLVKPNPADPKSIGLLPVDEEGVLLPSGDFSPIEAARYPRLAGVDSVPHGPVGTRWGDARVAGAAEIASLLGPSWDELGLDRIVPSPLAEFGHGDEYAYELYTIRGSRIFWGRAPSADMPGEVSAAEKYARLRNYVHENGSLEGHDGPLQIDLRSPTRMEVTRRIDAGPAGAAR